MVEHSFANPMVRVRFKTRSHAWDMDRVGPQLPKGCWERVEAGGDVFPIRK